MYTKIVKQTANAIFGLKSRAIACFTRQSMARVIVGMVKNNTAAAIYCITQNVWQFRLQNLYAKDSLMLN